MRIYAVADIHGKPAKIESIPKVLIKLKPDALVVAGECWIKPLEGFMQDADGCIN